MVEAREDDSQRSKNPSEHTPAGVFRRLGAMFYDGLLIIALWMVATALLLPFTGGEAITSETVGALEYVYRGVLLGIFVSFFGLFWTRRGQTLGMAAWKLRVERLDGTLLSWSDVVKRLAAACVSFFALGLGYFWVWIDPERRTWHDRWTATRVVVLPKRR